MVDAVYYLNVGKAVGRRRGMEALGHRLGLSLHRFDAVPYTDLSKDVKRRIDTTLLTPDGKFERDAERGCAASHALLWRHIHRMGHQATLILEDDVDTLLTGEQLGDAIAAALQAMPRAPDGTPDYDVLYLGACIDDCTQLSRVAPPPASSSSSSSPWASKLYETKAPLCHHAYILSARGVVKALRELPLPCPADLQFQYAIGAGRMKAYRFFPSLVYQDVVRHTSSLRDKAQALLNTRECEFHGRPRRKLLLVAGCTLLWILVILGVLCVLRR